MKIVVGMHRSGTSLLMRLLARAGADPGDPRGFYPADEWNPDGYLEQREILTANRALLHGPLGRLAFLLPPTRRQILRRAPCHEPELRRLSKEYAHRLVKDPRFLFTEEAWAQAGTRFTHVLAVFREPEEVAASLWRRNRLPRVLAMRMMAVHFRAMLDFSVRHPTRWVRYDRLVAEGAGVAEFAAAATFLGLPCDEATDGGWFRSVVRLRPPRPGPEPDYPGQVGQLWAELCRRHSAQAAAGSTVPR